MSPDDLYGEPQVMSFRDGKDGAFTMQFDDSMESQASIALPIMNERGLVGTFFVNPAHTRHQATRSAWEDICPRFRHELANHTMHHTGAKSYEEADREIGECSRYIWSLYPTRSKLLPFARGGGTTWDISDGQIDELMRKYYLFRRPSKYGICDDPASEYYQDTDILGYAREAMDEKARPTLGRYRRRCLEVPAGIPGGDECFSDGPHR
jgi:peptidoglycan/xylan/chitin deacetylase (PgdA/CDA1 family)